MKAMLERAGLTSEFDRDAMSGLKDVLLRRIQAREVLLIGLATCVLVSVLFSMTILKPTSNRIDNKRHQLSQLDQRMLAITNELRFLSNISKEEYAANELRESQIQNYSKLSRNEIIKKIINGLSAFNLSLVSIKYDKTTAEEENAFRRTGISMELNGSYNDIGKYLFFLKEAPILLDYVSMTVKTEENSGTLLMSLQINFFYL